MRRQTSWLPALDPANLYYHMGGMLALMTKENEPTREGGPRFLKTRIFGSANYYGLAKPSHDHQTTTVVMLRMRDVFKSQMVSPLPGFPTHQSNRRNRNLFSSQGNSEKVSGCRANIQTMSSYVLRHRESIARGLDSEAIVFDTSIFNI